MEVWGRSRPTTLAGRLVRRPDIEAAWNNSVTVGFLRGRGVRRRTLTGVRRKLTSQAEEDKRKKQGRGHFAGIVSTP